MDIAFRSASEMAEAVRSRAISALDLLEHHLARVRDFNPELNAIVVPDFERARARAAEADAALARGESWGPLHGVPMTVKESFDVAGLPTSWGDPGLRDEVAAANAPTVQALLDAGAVIFGKTNIPYLLSDWQTFNAIHGTTNNPWDLARAPGGSSGGAAAAVAAGLSALELGSDIGASIRNPAHFCGIYGHKPSFGIVPQAGHSIPVARTPIDILVCGPLARSADDLALALDILVRPEPDQAAAWRVALPPPRRTALKDFRVAAMLDSAICPVDGKVAAVLEAAVAKLEAAGVAVDREARPDFDMAASHDLYLQLLRGATGALMAPEAFAAVARDARDLGAAASYRAKVARGAVQSHRDWFAASERRAVVRAAWARFFTRFDVLLCPVAGVQAYPHDQETPRYDRVLPVNGASADYNAQLFWAGIASLPYLPATAAPAGRTGDGLPVGLQILGPFLEDRTTIAFARAVEDVLGGFEAPPRYAA